VLEGDRPENSSPGGRRPGRLSLKVPLRIRSSRRRCTSMSATASSGPSRTGRSRRAIRRARRSSPARPRRGRSCSRPAPAEIDVGGDAAARLAAQSNLRSSALPIVMFEADRLVRISAPASAPRSRAGRRPIILADLDVEDEVGEIVGGEDQVGAERRRLAGELDLQPVRAEARGEPALLVIFAVIGQEALGTTPRIRPRRSRGAVL
jgi:hypothetical protein